MTSKNAFALFTKPALSWSYKIVPFPSFPLVPSFVPSFPGGAWERRFVGSADF
jgi:hypothetical protein